MMSPQKPEGNEVRAKTRLSLVLKQLDEILADVGSETEIGRATLKAISSIAKLVGKDLDRSQELSDAERMIALQGVAGPGAPPKGPPPGAGAAPPPPPGA